ncbi:MAG: Ppx/GppA family phosphatase [Coleofasciculaceae cyanobacterium SM2_1_6]|nr:Ppx/GppA family phosphatase [Coleofasciculaceae cyanobacterium SM2_1_6]
MVSIKGGNLRQDQISAEAADRILAAIDIGTNSIHMVIVRVQPQLPTFTIIARERDTVRLGDRCFQTGNLKPELMERALASLSRCQQLAASYNADHIIAVATSAVREASNGRAFIQQIQQELNLSVDLISGQEEARRIYLGVLSGMELNNRPHIIIDIGGGSTELILGDNHEPRFLSSTKVGAVRLSAEYVTTDPISDQEYAYLHAYIQGMLERPVDELKAFLGKGELVQLLGTSGTIETLANIHARENLGVVPSPLTGYQLTRPDVADLLQRFRTLDHQQRCEIPGLSTQRAEIILAGTMILHTVMVMLDLDSLVIGERALREGIIVDWMLAHGLIEDRLKYQDSVRQRSVLNIAQKYQLDLPYADRTASFALSIFDQTQGRLHQATGNARELLWAAALLHNCGVFISHSSHHKHSYYMIRHAELLGFTETEIEIIANIARYHRKAPPKKKHEGYQNLLTKDQRLLVSQMSGILRLAVALDRRQIGAIKAIKCHFPNPQVLILELTPTWNHDDCALELWSLDQKKEVFQQEFNIQVITKLTSNSG